MTFPPDVRAPGTAIGELSSLQGSAGSRPSQGVAQVTINQAAPPTVPGSALGGERGLPTPLQGAPGGRLREPVLPTSPETSWVFQALGLFYGTKTLSFGAVSMNICRQARSHAPDASSPVQSPRGRPREVWAGFGHEPQEGHRGESLSLRTLRLQPRTPGLRHVRRSRLRAGLGFGGPGGGTPWSAAGGREDRSPSTRGRSQGRAGDAAGGRRGTGRGHRACRVRGAVHGPGGRHGHPGLSREGREAVA